MINDEKKKVALDLLTTILQDNNLNSILTTDSENDNPFVIIEDWKELGTIQKELNKQISPKSYYRWCITYYNEYGNEAFQDMRFGWTKEKWDKKQRPCNVHHGLSPYLIPEGLFSLHDIVDWRFSDEHTTCSNCYRAIATTPGYYGDKLRYEIINCEVLCGDCIVNNFEDEYIEYITNYPKRALKTSIISEDRLEELGWKKLSRTYHAGIREGNNDDPKKVFNRYIDKFDEILFTYESGQFDLDFWMWIKHEKPASDDAGSYEMNNMMGTITST